MKKRGKDHEWDIRKLDGDIALYAHCKCGYEYVCSSNKRNADGTFSFEQEVTNIFPYCPVCGARKKRFGGRIGDKFIYGWV